MAGASEQVGGSLEIRMRKIDQGQLIHGPYKLKTKGTERKV